MIISLVQKLMVSYYRFMSNIKDRHNTVDIFDQLKKASRVLVCLPKEKEGVEAFCASINKMREIFPSAHIILLVDQINRELCKFTRDFQIVEYNPNQAGPFGLPDSKTKQELFKNDIDIFIDLNKSFEFMQTALAIQSNARLKICFNQPLRNSLYNVIIRVEKEQSWASNLETVYKCL